MEITLKKSSVLACQKQNRSIVKVGLDIPNVTDVPVTPKSDDQLMMLLSDYINQLWKDISLDACPETYGPECVGQDKEVDDVTSCIQQLHADDKVVDAKSVLKCAGVDPTDENVKKFADCVKSKLSGSSSVPTGTLAFCAVQVKRGLTGTKVHSSLNWRGDYETWMRMFGVWKEKVASTVTGIPSGDELNQYRNRYNTFRNQFIANGGKTSTKKLDETKLIPTWVYYAGGVIVLILVGSQVAQIVIAAKSIK